LIDGNLARARASGLDGVFAEGDALAELVAVDDDQVRVLIAPVPGDRQLAFGDDRPLGIAAVIAFRHRTIVPYPSPCVNIWAWCRVFGAWDACAILVDLSAIF